jgi:hypothetical protein
MPESKNSPLIWWIGVVLAAVAITMVLFTMQNDSKETIETGIESTDDKSDEAESQAADDNDSPVTLINDFYQYVLGKKEMTNDVIDQYLSSELKRELWEADYDRSYSIFRFRTSHQDSKYGAEEISKVKDVKYDGNDWYTVTYLDMGHEGMTQVKISDGKIVDLKLDKSWNSNNFKIVKEAYLDLISRYAANDYATSYYFLFDITGDGIPELWITSGTCEADNTLSVYTYNDGLVAIDKGESGNASHSNFYKGRDYIIQVGAHQGSAAWQKITYQSGILSREWVFEEDLNQTGKEYYTEPSEPGVVLYSSADSTPIVSL